MSNELEFASRTLAIGVGATMLMDLWAFVLRRLGVPSLDFGLLGRWIGHLREGRWFHDGIAKATPVPGERAIGWSAHYAIGTSFAALLLATFGLSWARSPSLAPALLIGMVTVIAPLFVLQPALGAGDRVDANAHADLQFCQERGHAHRLRLRPLFRGACIRSALPLSNARMSSEQNLNAQDALTRLKEGNRRYAQNVRSVDSLLSHSRRDSDDQQPFAIVLGCSDSRAPAEIVFDQGLGDLFVIRVAGNIVAPSQIGSVEFAAERFGTRARRGHGPHQLRRHRRRASSRRRHAARRVAQPRSIVDRVRPAIEALVRTDLANDPSGCGARPCAPTCARRSTTCATARSLERLAVEDGLAGGRRRARSHHGRGAVL